MDEFAGMEDKVAQLVESGNTEAAVDALFELIVRYIEEKRFDDAAAAREHLIEIDSLALTQIIKSAELIEAARSESVDRSHMEIFSDLYQTLTTEESNALYFALQEITADVDQPVYHQDAHNSRLYFIDQGELKIIFREGEKETLLKKIGSGDIAGDDTFFSIAVCTTSLIPLSRSQIRCLEIEKLQALKLSFPALEPKLKDYCATLERVTDLLQKKGMDRRRHKRVKLEGLCSNQLIDKAGVVMGKPFRGELLDISCSGIAFLGKFTADSARLLLGRTLDVSFLRRNRADDDTVTVRGTVVGVNFHFFNEYSIHIKFEQPIPEQEVDSLECIPDDA